MAGLDPYSQLTIDGAGVTGEGAPIEVFNPATEETIATVAAASLEQVDAAIASSRRAFDQGPWPQLSRDQRAEAIHAFAKGLEAAADELLELAIAEVGTPISLASTLHTSAPALVVHNFAELAREDPTEALGPHVGPPRSASLIAYRPAGVAVGIAPYNYPVMLGLNKVGAALAAGCTHVWLPSPRTPLTTLRIGQVGVESGLPAGVLNVIAGGPEVGARASDRPDVDRVSFTGSVAVGKEIMRQASNHITGVTLELGGKSANIVMPGTELSEKAVHAMHARYARNAGQGCMSPTRILIPRADEEEFLARTKDVYANLPVGDPRDPGTMVGPLIRAEHRESVEGFVERALAAGGKILAGGGRPDTGKGWYMNPTLVGNVAPDSEIASTELFGPVAVLFTYESLDEAVEIANSTIYGLAAYINGPDLNEAVALAARMRAGSVFVNGGGASRPDAPIGGMKQSGIGREKGHLGLADFLEPQHVQFPV
jgi:aldehyde dehydrogenase (NAD+)